VTAGMELLSFSEASGYMPFCGWMFRRLGSLDGSKRPGALAERVK
jgi:hypothetical protein